MNRRGKQTCVLFGLSLVAVSRGAIAGDSTRVEFDRQPDRVRILVGGRPLATYVYKDEKIPRPYFCSVFAPGGIPVTRNHPPIEGKDPTDHPTYHPGIWMAFGDLSGADYWRNKAKVLHEGFQEEPRGGTGTGRFAVRNRYLAGDGDKEVVCTERCRFAIHVRPAGYFLIWDSLFAALDRAFWFGDQEEMGLGVRVATPICVKAGGKILDSEGRVNQAQVWGNAAEWCDYNGLIDGKHVGVTLMPDPKNFRPSWFHARDYGLLLANPFGRQAFKKGPASKVVVKPGQSFRLRYGVLLHASLPETPANLKAAYADFLDLLSKASGE